MHVLGKPRSFEDVTTRNGVFSDLHLAGPASSAHLSGVPWSISVLNSHNTRGGARRRERLQITTAALECVSAGSLLLVNGCRETCEDAFRASRLQNDGLANGQEKTLTPDMPGVPK